MQSTYVPKIKKLLHDKKMLLIAAGSILILGIGIALIVTRGGFFSRQESSEDERTYSEENDKQANAIKIARDSFSSVEYNPIKVEANLPSYDLGDNNKNIYNLSRIELSDDALSLLGTNYFFVDRDYDRGKEEFFPLYENNRYEDFPSFITTDSVLHTYHLAFDNTLKSLEEAVFYEQLKDITKYMLEESQEQYKFYKEKDNQEFTTAAKRNVAYYCIGAILLDMNIEVPKYVQDVVSQELDLIEKRKGVRNAIIMNIGFKGDTIQIMTPQGPLSVEKLKEDYSQYIPRGHYTKSEILKKYFKTMMWYGRMTFRQKVESENISALLITEAIENNDKITLKWQDIYDATSFLVGESDDLTFYDYGGLVDKIYDKRGLENLPKDPMYSQYIEDLADLRSPIINSMPKFESQDTEEEIKGFRFMGQRYTLDAEIFQHLVYKEIDPISSTKKRMLPKSLDIVAAMGSKDAENLLKENTDSFDYPNYEENLNKLKSQISEYDTGTWTQNVYWGWLYTIKPYSTPLTEGYPSFMQNTAWKYKDINSYQASWTELKHDTILYAKQTYAELGAGGYGKPIDYDHRGYVEPRIEIYERLEWLSKATRQGLKDRDLLKFSKDDSYVDPDCMKTMDNKEYCTIDVGVTGKEIEETLKQMEDISSKLKEISRKELENKALTEKEYEFITEFGGQLEHMWMTLTNSKDVHTGLEDNPVMLVSDVATDPNGPILQEGTGYVLPIYVVIPTPGEDSDYLRVARGGVWSQYEFENNLSNRLTDEKWQEKVRNNDIPEIPKWKQSYMEGTGTTLAARNISYKESIDNGNISLKEAKDYCESNGYTFKECGNACPENNPDCDKSCEPVCIRH